MSLVDPYFGVRFSVTYMIDSSKIQASHESLLCSLNIT